MATSTYRVDDELKKQAGELCEQMGMSLNTAINIFLRQMVRERRLPFTPSVAELPPIGYTAPNGVVFEGTDDRGYPKLAIPSSLVYTPKRDTDDTPILPQEWKE